MATADLAEQLLTAPAGIFQPAKPPRSSLGDFLDVITAIASFVPAGNGALQAALKAADLVAGQTVVNGNTPASQNVVDALKNPSQADSAMDALVNTGKAAANAIAQVRELRVPG